jgi:oligoribonuclease (3'-5' exoribonuclease)
LILWITLVSPSFAQGVAPEAYDSWNKDATRAEAVVENAQASDAALEALRSQIVDWRQKFLDAQSQDIARVAILEDQLMRWRLYPKRVRIHWLIVARH